jgi:HSP20 family protein
MDDLLPPLFWRKLRKQSGQVLGDEFWTDLAHLLPRQEMRVDVFRYGSELVVVAELSGRMQAGQLKLSTNGKTLLIRGDTPYDYPVPEEELLLAERTHGIFERTIALPVAALSDGMRAVYRQGLLTVWLTLAPEPDDRQIDVAFPDRGTGQ